jgi:predicted glutamine amidotransferase
MCRILGIRNFDFRKHRELLENFARLADTGMVVRGWEPGHRDGWGIGWSRENRSFVHKSGNSILRDRKTYLEKLEAVGSSGILIVHLRKSAWKGTTSAANSHPFKHKDLMLAHNGTILDYKKLLKKTSPACRPASGALDSEVFLRFLSSSLSASGAGATRELTGQTLKKSFSFIEDNCSYSALNCVIAHKSGMYAYRDFTQHADYYSLYRAERGQACIICSEPISGKMRWELLGKKELFTA